MSVRCLKPGCAVTWDADPVFAVTCPDCRAAPGRCCKRPSGWSGPFTGFHPARDVAADAVGAYGRCPSGRYGAASRPEQLGLAL